MSTEKKSSIKYNNTDCVSRVEVERSYTKEIKREFVNKEATRDTITHKLTQLLKYHSTSLV